MVSYDLNYRPSLWKGIGGAEKARAVNRELVSFVDVLFGNEEDFSVALGFDVEGVDERLGALPAESFKTMIGRVRNEFAALQVVATTLRVARTATRTIGAPSPGATASSTKQHHVPTSRSSTASAAAIRSRPA